MASVCRRRFLFDLQLLGGTHLWIPWKPERLGEPGQKSQRQGEKASNGALCLTARGCWGLCDGLQWRGDHFYEEGFSCFLFLVERSLRYNITLVSGVWWFGVCTCYEMVIVMSLSSHLSPYRGVTVSLPVLLVSPGALWLTGTSGGFCHLIPFPLQMGRTTHLPPPTSLPLLITTVWSLYLSVSLHSIVLCAGSAKLAPSSCSWCSPGACDSQRERWCPHVSWS